MWYTIKRMIEVKGIKKGYSKRKLLIDVELKAECGQTIVIIGRNGCGKTTLMQILAGILKPDEGKITYFGQEPLVHKKLFREYCGYVPQENPLIEELSVKDNLWLWGGKSSKVLEQLTETFQLQDIWKTPVEKISGGMKRRLSIACALVKWPPILLLDEPTTALDLYHKGCIHDLFMNYKKKNGIIIMTTHDEQEILSADRCLMMQQGKLIELSAEERNIEVIKKYLAVE